MRLGTERPIRADAGWTFPRAGADQCCSEPRRSLDAWCLNRRGLKGSPSAANGHPRGTGTRTTGAVKLRSRRRVGARVINDCRIYRVSDGERGRSEVGTAAIRVGLAMVALVSCVSPTPPWTQIASPKIPGKSSAQPQHNRQIRN